MEPKTVDEIRAFLAYSDPFETYRAWKQLFIPPARLAAARQRNPDAAREIERLESLALESSNGDERRTLLLRAAQATIELLQPRH